ncbi:MAG TPA: MBL fold metallo-hydrolase [Gaiellaceae bacterium]|nr:MBL fold metallo-hydrolase [Gaiellaceae bacterium]
MDTLGPIDLHHQGAERVIGCYLLETPEGLALNDCGPSTCLPALKRGLEERGLSLEDVDHLLLSHIHLDHAGAAGILVREQPNLRVHVSEVGAPHLADPSRLERSARRLYGDAFDELWGEVAPVPEENLEVVGETALGLEVLPTPGHASHHVCYVGADGTLYAGDAAGVRIAPDGYACPPTPPPEFDLATWLRSIDEIERRAPTRLALIHFGVVDDPGPHLDQLRRRLRDWTAGDVPEDEWLRRREEERAAASSDPDAYERAMPLWQSYAGLRRYWDTAADTGSPTIAPR